MSQLSDEVLAKIEAIPNFGGWSHGGRARGYSIFTVKGQGSADEFDAEPIEKMVHEKLVEILGADYDDLVCFSVSLPLRVRKAFYPDGALLAMSENERKDLISGDLERLKELESAKQADFYADLEGDAVPFAGAPEHLTGDHHDEQPADPEVVVQPAPDPAD